MKEPKVIKDYHKADPFYQREAEKYENPVPSREFIMQYLEAKGRPVTREHLLNAFNLESEEQREALRRRLIAMERDGQILSNRRGSYGLVDKLELIKGRVVGHKDGFGFLVPDDGSQDIFLTPQQMRNVFPRDRVLVRVAHVDRRGRREGIIVEVLERNTQRIVGRYFVSDGVAFVTPSNKDVTQDIIIPPGQEMQAKHGQMVVAEVVAQPSLRRQPLGKVIEILGEQTAPGMEIEIAMRAYGIPYDWPELVLEEAKTIEAILSSKDYHGREDIRHLPLVTIDGEDAKDFDDAVFCEARSQGGWRLFVAIADVGHYVKHNTEIDKEAQKRGNSVYFPGRVVPMLPEKLSNELCSLQPQVDRLCMVCEMTISAQGKMTRYRFYDAVMKSHARLTYTEVAAILQGEKTQHTHLVPHLKQLHRLYQLLRKQRWARGAIEFDTLETRIVFDKNGKISHVVPVVRNDAHRIIEECMLSANVAAAKLLLQHRLPALYRVHEGPDPEKLDNLRDFLRGFGLRLSGGDAPEPLDYKKLLDRIDGRPDQQLIQTVLLRSLSQAVYTPINRGHFGLAYEAYAHFTSPIRRYPDLVVHRAIRHVTSKKAKVKHKYAYDKTVMMNLGDHCSMTERRADEATRDAVGRLKCEYMLDKVGHEFDGIISGVTAFGIFVELKNIMVEGLVHITALKNDYYHFDAIKHQLKGRRSGAIYRLGDPISIRVVRVNLDEREIDFEPAKISSKE